MNFRVSSSVRSSITFRSRASSIVLRNYLRSEAARKNNLVITGYPKCGTTWITQLMAHLAGLEFRQGEPRFHLSGVALHTHAINFNGKKNLLYAVRDPREAVCSAARALQANDVTGVVTQDGQLTEEFVHYAITNHEGARNSMRDHLQTAFDQNWYFIRFEDLKTKPEETLAIVASNLGINAKSENISNAIGIFDFSRRRAQSEKKWFFAESAMASWKGLLSSKSLDYIELTVGKQAERFGYDLSVRPENIDQY